MSVAGSLVLSAGLAGLRGAVSGALAGVIYGKLFGYSCVKCVKVGALILSISKVFTDVINNCMIKYPTHLKKGLLFINLYEVVSQLILYKVLYNNKLVSKKWYIILDTIAIVRWILLTNLQLKNTSRSNLQLKTLRDRTQQSS